MQPTPAPISAPVHRLAPAVRAFFVHNPRPPFPSSWPAPLHALARRIRNLLDPPLEPSELHALLEPLHWGTEAERAVLVRWQRIGTSLRESDRRVIEAYLAETADTRRTRENELADAMAELEASLEPLEPLEREDVERQLEAAERALRW